MTIWLQFSHISFHKSLTIIYLFRISSIRFFRWKLLQRRRLCNSIPSDFRIRLCRPFVALRGMKLLLVHHGVQSQNPGQIDDLISAGVGKSDFGFVTQIDVQLDLLVQFAAGFGFCRWNPFLASDGAWNVRNCLGTIGGVQSLIQIM